MIAFAKVPTALLGAIVLTVVAAAPAGGGAPPCRFSPSYSQADILKNPAKFEWDLLYWEGKFHQDGVGYNSTSGLTYDGTLLYPTSGLANASGRHEFSAASKESLHVMVLAHSLNGDARAARFLSPNNMAAAPNIAYNIMKTKLATYNAFNESYPGYGGYLPWYLQGNSTLTPTSDWVNRVPGLDNGELIWAVYAATYVLETSKNSQWQALATGWQAWLDRTKATGATIFYKGSGHVCAVTDIHDDTQPVNAPGQTYNCEGTSNFLDDPYEGELFTWWLYFFGGLSKKDRNALWVFKRPQLRNVEYKQGSIGPITVQQGFWFSSHEQWKVLEMPYYDVPLVKRLFNNAERARTCNSVVNGYDGEFASVNNVTDYTGQITGYISDAGIPSISNQTTFELDVITPYSVFPTALFNKGVALAWWKNMVDGAAMQNPYGSTESEQRSGKAISSFVSWDSKITTVNALLGGVSDFVRAKMKKDGIYNEFLSVVQREYGMKFNINQLKGEDQALCLPKVKVPHTGLKDYTSCHT